jgi:hypothetical protein
MFELVFQVILSMRNFPYLHCPESFCCVTADCTGRLSICLKVKVLMSLKVLGFRVYHQTLNGIFHQRMSHADARRLMYQQHHGVPGLVGSIDCMYDGWRLSLVAWQGQFEGTKNDPH